MVRFSFLFWWFGSFAGGELSGHRRNEDVGHRCHPLLVCGRSSSCIQYNVPGPHTTGVKMGWYPFEMCCTKGTLDGLKGGAVFRDGHGLRSVVADVHPSTAQASLRAQARARLIFADLSQKGNTPLRDGKLDDRLEGVHHFCSTDLSGHLDAVDFYAVLETHVWHP
jgi:hypothetical protein